MSFIMDTLSLEKTEDVKKHYKQYHDYLESVKNKMPINAYSFAVEGWHYDPQDHRCPHDSWLKSFEIREISSGEREEVRRIEIVIILLGAYHDGHIKLIYKNVISYSLVNLDKAERVLHPSIGHGDWLIDELRLAEGNNVIHEIKFSSGSHWLIECGDVTYLWKPINL